MKKSKTMFAASLVLVLSMALFTPASVLAATTGGKTPIPLGSVAEMQEGSLPLPVQTPTTPIDVPPELIGMPLSQGTPLARAPQDGGRVLRSPVSITNAYQGAFSAEGEMTYLTFTLGYGLAVQATLDCPPDNSVDYTLYLFTVENGALTQAVDVSNFDTKVNPNGKTLSEMLNYIHFEQTNQDYALVVIASRGFSATPFTLTVSLDHAGYMDAYETDDNPLYEIARLPALTENTKFSGHNLNVENDNDWFIWTSPASTTTFDRFSVETRWPGYEDDEAVVYAHNIELYKQVPNTKQMELVNFAQGEIISIEPNTEYYIRVWSDAGQMTSSNSYELGRVDTNS